MSDMPFLSGICHALNSKNSYDIKLDWQKGLLNSKILDVIKFYFNFFSKNSGQIEATNPIIPYTFYNTFHLKEELHNLNSNLPVFLD